MPVGLEEWRRSRGEHAVDAVGYVRGAWPQRFQSRAGAA
ncbi:MAG: hypothetical protein QOH13_1868, partial [Thermoleophilaceae bacterium]|nr:hypothetical protein [Thermoleophilaceae bacterium]